MKFNYKSGRLNREQKVALVNDRHLVLIANAGSGKTTVLAEKYLDLILNHEIDPKTILALTFTNKSAQEMRIRILKKFDEFLESRKNDVLEYAELKLIRQKITQANISTFDALCNQLLKEYSIEAEIDANFQLIKEFEKQRIIKDSVYNKLNNLLDQKYDKNLDQMDENEKYIDYLLTYFGSKFISILVDYIQIDSFYDYALKYDGDKEKLSEKLRIYINEYFNNYELKYIVDLYLNDLDLKNYETKTNKDKIQLASPLLEQIQAGKEFDFTDEVWRSKLLQLLEIKNGSSLLYSMYFKGKENLKNNKILIEFYSDQIKNFRKILKNDLIIHFDAYIEFVHNIYIFTQKAFAEIEHEMEENSIFTYKYITRKAIKLLKNEEFAQYYRSKFTHLMIDEFQDTDPIQFEFAKIMIPDLDQESNSFIDKNEDQTIENQNIENQNIKLFIVGDPKQSIYGFRLADIRVFHEAIKLVRNANARLNFQEINSDLIVQNELVENGIKCYENQGIIHLQTTYRLRKKPAAATNYFFDYYMKSYLKNSDSKLNFEVNYDQMIVNSENYEGDFAIIIPQKKETNENESIVNKNIENNSQSLEILQVEHELYDSEENIVSNKNINTIYNENDYVSSVDLMIKHIITKYKESSNKDSFFKHTAVICFKNEEILFLAEKLKEKNIPVQITNNKKLIDFQEIMDICSYFNFLNDSSDDISLIAILKSPFFAFNEKFIYKIIKSLNKNQTVFEFIKSFESSKSKNLFSEEEIKEILETTEVLESARTLSSRLSLSQLILVLLEKSKWNLILSSSPEKGIINNNIGLLIDLARDFESKGFKNIVDFTNYISSKSFDDESKDVELTTNAITISTIHKAKGLEYENVYVFLKHRFNSNNNTIFDEYIIKKFPIKNEENDYQEIGVSTIFNKLIHLNGDAENKRKLYVAFTRAISNLYLVFDRIVLTEDEKVYLVKNTKNTELKEDSYIYQLIKKFVFDKHDKKHILNHNQNGFFEIELDNLLINQDIKTIDSQTEFTYNSKSDFQDLTTSITSILSNEIFSASKLNSFNEEDPSNFIHKYIYGYRDSAEYTNFRRKELEDERDENLDPSKFGIIIHAILEKIEEHIENNKVNHNKVLEYIKVLGINLQLKLEQNSQEFIQQIENICSTDLFQENFKYFSNSKHEYNLIMPIADNFITGVIDLLLEKENGDFEIWDWKTNQIQSKSQIKSLADTYKNQMMLYAYLVWNQKKSSVIKARLLFTNLAKVNVKDEDWTYLFQWTEEDMIKFGIELEEKIYKMISYHIA